MTRDSLRDALPRRRFLARLAAGSATAGTLALSSAGAWRATATALVAAGAVTVARAQSAAAMLLDVRPGSGRFVKLRWPETTLLPRTAGELVAVVDGNGAQLPFTVIVDPDDAGRSDRPLWLVIRLDGPAPYTMSVGSAVHGQYRRNWTDVVDDASATLDSLPSATSARAQAWSEVSEQVSDAEAIQQASNRTWRNWALGGSAVGLVLLGLVVRRLGRHQPGGGDVSKL